MGEVAAAYRGVRERVTTLVEAGDADAVVPGCPAWSVKDVVGHLAGVIADILDGRLDGVATDPWTAAQVDARRETSLADVLAEWNARAPEVEAIVDGFGGAGHQLVFDAVTHEHDVRGALHRPGATDTDAVRIGAGFGVPGYLAVVAERKLPALGVSTPSGASWASGDQPSVRLRATEFELLRALTGRRTVDQVRALEWDG